MGFVADTTREAKAEFFNGWHYMFSRMAKERRWPNASRAQFDAYAGAGGAFLIGDPETVAAKALAASDVLGGVDRISFQMSAASGDRAAMLHSIELLGTSVAEILRASQHVAA